MQRTYRGHVVIKTAGRYVIQNAVGQHVGRASQITRAMDIIDAKHRPRPLPAERQAMVQFFVFGDHK